MWAWFDVVADMGIPVVSRAPRINLVKAFVVRIKLGRTLTDVAQIVAYHKMSEPLPAELKAKFDAGGVTLISTWTPQQYVLAHPVSICMSPHDHR